MDSFIGQIIMVGFNYAPPGWALCNGQLLPIQQYTALYALLGTTYGGNGTTNFALPNLQGRVPLHPGTLSGGGTYQLGQAAGSENVTLITAQMPAHSHNLVAIESLGTTADPTGNYLAQVPDADSLPATSFSNSQNPTAVLSGNSIGIQGSSQGHPNLQPYLAVNFIIATQGIFPPRP